jgi:outer membrane lipoprotein-sorting protein
MKGQSSTMIEKSRTITAVLGAVIILVLSAGFAMAEPDKKDSEALITQAPAFPKGLSMSADVEMTHYLENGEVRTAKWKMWRSAVGGNDRIRLEIDVPVERKGSILRARQEMESKNNKKRIWFFDAKKDKRKEITGAKRRKNFLDSEFSFEQIAEDYSLYSHYRKLSYAVLNGRNCLLIEGTEKADLKKSGRRIRFWIDREDLILIKVDYQDKKGRLQKSLKFGNFQKLGGSSIPCKWEMRDEKEKTRTIINLKNLKLKKILDERLFDYDYPGEGGK